MPGCWPRTRPVPAGRLPFATLLLPRLVSLLTRAHEDMHLGHFCSQLLARGVLCSSASVGIAFSPSCCPSPPCLSLFPCRMLPARGGRPPPAGFAAASSEPSLLGRGSAAGRIGLAWQRPWGNVLPSQCGLWGFALRSLPLLAEGECIFVGPLLWPATSELSGSSLCFV